MSKNSHEMKVGFLRAASLGNKEPPITIIDIRHQIDLNPSSTAYMGEEERRMVHVNEAKTLADLLFASLPGGTMDELLAEMMRRKASLLSVVH